MQDIYHLRQTIQHEISLSTKDFTDLNIIQDKRLDSIDNRTTFTIDKDIPDIITVINQILESDI
jgi:hypothetical protein